MQYRFFPILTAIAVDLTVLGTGCSEKVKTAGEYTAPVNTIDGV